MEQLYKQSINNLIYYNKINPDIDQIVKAIVISFEESYILCYLPEFKKNATLFYRELTNIKKIKNIKKKFKDTKIMILKVISCNNDFIELSKKEITDKNEDNYNKFFIFYEKLIKIFVKCYIWNCITIKKKNIEDVQLFLNNSLLTLKIDYHNFNYYIEKYFTNSDIFTDTIQLNDDFLKKNINTMISKLIELPNYKIIINYKITCFDLGGVNEIITFLDKLSIFLKQPIVSTSVPNYQTLVIKKFKSQTDVNLFLDNIIKKIKDFNYNKDIINFNIEDYTCFSM